MAEESAAAGTYHHGRALETVAARGDEVARLLDGRDHRRHHPDVGLVRGGRSRDRLELRLEQLRAGWRRMCGGMGRGSEQNAGGPERWV